MNDALNVHSPLAEELENKLQCDLSDTWIFCGAQSAEVSVVDSGEIINGPLVIEEVNLVEDIEELAPELDLVTLCNIDHFR